MRFVRLLLVVCIVLGAWVCSASADTPSSGKDPILGTWAGMARYGGDSAEFILHFAKQDELTVTFDLPRTNIAGVAMGSVTREGNVYSNQVLRVELSADAQTLKGTFTTDRELALDLKRQDKPSAAAPKPAKTIKTKTPRPAWTFHTDGPIWSSPATSESSVFFGSNDGFLYALQSATGKLMWKFETGKAVVARPTIDGKNVYVVSDDGYVYKLNADSGKEIWRSNTNGGPVQRDPPGLHSDRYDSFASSVTVQDHMVFVGSADGSLYTMDEQTGAKRWIFDTKGIVRSTPAVADGLVFFGSFDHFVYAVDEKTGVQRWSYDTHQPVVSSPVFADGTIYIGSRSSDVFALDAETGKVKWSYYYWLSWVESSGVVSDGVLYIGSSDYQLLFALDTNTGKPIWSFDTDGSAWSTPAVTKDTVYIGAAGTVGYMINHHGGFFAVDRKSGMEKWHVPFDAIPGSFAYGVASSPAVTHGLVLFGGLDGTFYAFKE